MTSVQGEEQRRIIEEGAKKAEGYLKSSMRNSIHLKSFSDDEIKIISNAFYRDLVVNTSENDNFEIMAQDLLNDIKKNKDTTDPGYFKLRLYTLASKLFINEYIILKDYTDKYCNENSSDQICSKTATPSQVVIDLLSAKKNNDFTSMMEFYGVGALIFILMLLGIRER